MGCDNAMVFVSKSTYAMQIFGKFSITISMFSEASTLQLASRSDDELARTGTTKHEDLHFIILTSLELFS